MRKFTNNYSVVCTVFAILTVVQAAGCAPTTKFTSGERAAIAEETITEHKVIIEELNNLDLLNRVAWPILAMNAGLCQENVEESYGLTLAIRETLPKHYRKVWQEMFDSKGMVFVLNVVEGSPAWNAGLRRGDTILKDNENNGYRTLQFRRTKRKQKVTIKPLSICNYNIEYKNEASLNAFTDGNNIYVTRGVIEFVDNNTELATVIAHELAHNIEWDCKNRGGNYLPIVSATLRNKRLVEIIKKIIKQLFVGVVTKEVQDVLSDVDSESGKIEEILNSETYNQDCESEADYIGLYLMARADFDTVGAVNFWKRLTYEKTKIIDYAKTHPTPSERVTRILETHAEIQRKLKIQPRSTLLPERKSNLRY